MSMTITTLKHHRMHIANAMAHYSVIAKLDQRTQPTEMDRLALEQHDDLMRYELSQAAESLKFCHQITATSTIKRQHIARIACIRLGKMAREIQGVRLP